MYRTLTVHFLPELTTPAEVAAGVVVVIDVLRASTTITTALAASAREVVPCVEVEEARQRAKELGRRSTQVAGDDSSHEPLLGGERGGLPIDGFDLGNSPSEFTPQRIAGRTVIFTTTNGTKALLACTAAQRILIGSFVNLSAVVRELTGQLPIHILCAGTRGRVTREDVLFAGALVEKLVGKIVEEEAINDEARISRDVWCHAMNGVQQPGQLANQRLAEVLRHTQGGRNLKNIGLDCDILDAADIDRFDFAPVFEASQWRIVRPTA
jgi:2-phosphosulfolactate phosphatase